MALLRSYIQLLCLLAVLYVPVSVSGWLFRSGSSSSRSSPQRHSHDIGSQSGLTELYNRRVVHAEGVRRPLGSGSRMLGAISHSGVRVRTADGSEWLVHKGGGYGGRGGDTVVVDAKHMSGRWETIPNSGRDVHRSTVGDYVRAGGQNYNLGLDNCHDARERGLDLQ